MPRCWCPSATWRLSSSAPPGWVLIERGVPKADQASAAFDDDRLTQRIGLPQPVGPNDAPIGDHVAVKEGVGIRAGSGDASCRA